MRQYRKIWSPQPKQAMALSCPATEVFFGGAAGGGKSDYMLADYAAGVSKYGKHWNGIIFRQTTSELEELQKRARELYTQLGAYYRGKGAGEMGNTWVFPNGATLKMRYLESEKDVGRYQGHQYTWVGIDELGNYPTPYCWEFMKSRLRSPYGVPCYIRGTANPGGVGHAWIKQKFMDDHVPNKIFTKEMKLDNGKVVTTTLCFIPSRLEDNAILMQNDPDYEARLMSLPGHLARAMRYGDWSVFDGQVFESFNTAKHVIKPMALPPGEWFKFCSMDWGWSHPYSIAFWAVNSQGHLIRYRELYGCQAGEFNKGVKKSARTLAQEAWEFAIYDGVKDMVADPAIWKDEKITEDSISIAQEFEKVGFKMHKANNDRINGLVMVDQFLKTPIDENGTPMLQVFNTCSGFIRTIPMLTPNPNRPEDVNTDLEDHIYDDTRYAVMSEFVKHPTVALRKQNGTWARNQTETYESYDPLKGF